MIIEGIIENIVFRNDDNGWTVLLVRTSETVFTLVGNIVNVNIGERISADVTKNYHETYGEQFSINSYKIVLPDDRDAIFRFIKSLKIKGVGDVTIKRIIDEFGESTLDVIKDSSEELYHIKGMSSDRINVLKDRVLNRWSELDIIIELGKYDLGPKNIEKVIEEYKDDALKVVKENPYKLALDIDGIGFNICDKIARINGISLDSDKRVEAALLYVLEMEYANGNVYILKTELFDKLKEILSVCSDKDFDDALYNLEINMHIKTDKLDDVDIVFKRSAYYIEKKLSSLLYSFKDNITIITGGPGTGKTYNIKKYLNEADKKGLKVALCAPTGRAAKRINELTGHEAKTIHRILECTGDKDGKGEKTYFNINEDNKLDTDFLIIDEMSMVDEYLMYSIMRALESMTAILLVGDVDQLPSVGAGQVLYDMIKSNYFEVIKLKKIYRQDDNSHIVENAHKVNEGLNVNFDEKHEDFIFTHRSTEDSINDAIKILVSKNVPNHFGIGIDQIQVVCPSKKGKCGVESLNKILQSEINPEDIMKSEIKAYGSTFRLGDKVMQTSNNYNLPYDIVDKDGQLCDRGVGIYNGDIGEIVSIDEDDKSVVVKYDDKLVYYLKEDLKDLTLAYAITVHKSQGSEYDVVIIPISRVSSKLMTRKILYTAMTRARKCIIFVGIEKIFDDMIKNTEENRRNTALCSKLYLYDV